MVEDEEGGRGMLMFWKNCDTCLRAPAVEGGWCARQNSIVKHYCTVVTKVSEPWGELVAVTSFSLKFEVTYSTTSLQAAQYWGKRGAFRVHA